MQIARRSRLKGGLETADEPGRIPTTVIGSMPKPGWLVADPCHPRWRFSGELLAEAQDDATRLAIRDQELAGIDVITDGEQRRLYYMSRLISSLCGIDFRDSTLANEPGDSANLEKPRVVGPVGRKRSFSVSDLKFLRQHTERGVKMTLPGPMTIRAVLQDDYYGDNRALGRALGDVLNQEMIDLQAAGCDVLQLDEPYAKNDPQAFFQWGREALDCALQGLTATTCVHFCFGYRIASENPKKRDAEVVARFRSILPEIAKCRTNQVAVECTGCGMDPAVLASELPADKVIVFGAVDNATTVVGDPADVAGRLRRACEVLGRERVWAAPDCGLVMLPRAVARAKLRSLVLGAARV